MEVPSERLNEVEKVRDIFWKILYTFKLYKLNNDGEIIIDGWPYVLIDTTLFYQISEQIKKMVGPVQKRIWYEFGKKSGFDIAFRFTKKFQESSFIKGLIIKLKTGLSFNDLALLKDKSTETIANKIWGYGLFAGWVGKLKMIKFDPEKEIILRVVNGFETYGYIKNKVKTKEPVCDFLRGVGAGLFSYWCKKDFEAKEIKCVAKGDKYCEVHVYPKGEENES